MKKVLIAIGLAVTLLLASCSSEADADYNDADLTFVHGMIVHHEQAVELSELVPDRTDNAAIIEQADQIIAAQQAEIEQLESWLSEWGQDSGHHNHGDHDMAGMIDENDVAELESSTGATFDELWLTLMIEHHEGAVEMANDVLADGVNENVRDLAETVIHDQQQEIEHMQELQP